MKKRSIRNKLLQVIQNEKGGGEGFFEMAIGVLIVFVLGGIVLQGLSTAFNTEIVPSVISKILELVSW